MCLFWEWIQKIPGSALFAASPGKHPMPLSTLNLKKVKRAWDCCASILEKLDRGEASIDSPGNKYPYDEGTKFASKITQKQITLTEAQRVEIEKMYRKSMTMAAIADTFGCHYTTVGRILRQRNVPIREK